MGEKKSGYWGGPGRGTLPPKRPAVEASVGRSRIGLSPPAGVRSEVPGKTLEAGVCRKP